ncbi:MAG TPA: diacylglycerol kinase family protein [Actinomycetota bacterium]
MRRALLLFNPEATSVSEPVRDLIAHALAADLKLEIAQTKRRGHATHLAAGAAHEDVDIVVCLGGDGTINEVANGLAGTHTPLVPLPGGSTNVFARTAGFPNDPILATSLFLRHLEEGAQPRRVGVGRVNGRVFVANAGIGLDAAIVRAVERRWRLKKRLGEAMFVAMGLKTFYLGYPRREAPIIMRAGSEVRDGLRTVIVCNSDPYTFLGRRPFRLCPNASLDAGLDVLGARTLGTIRSLRIIASGFGSARHARWRFVLSSHDTGGFRLDCARPLPLQVDGDYLGEGTSFAFESVPNALSVLT